VVEIHQMVEFNQLVRFGMKAPHEKAWWFFGVWIALAIIGLWVPYGDKNVAREKRLLPIFIVGSGTIFGVFALIVIGDLRPISRNRIDHFSKPTSA
jgi:hypothetical protein